MTTPAGPVAGRKRPRRSPKRVRAVVILAPPDDIHARVVAHEVESLGGRAHVLDTPRLQTDVRLSFSVGASCGEARLVVERRSISDDELCGVWLRRPTPLSTVAAPASLQTAAFCRAETRSLLRGWLLSLGPRVINPLAADEAAAHKPYQLAIAREVGLTIPETLIANDAQTVRTFARRHGALVFKTLTAHPSKMLETRRLLPSHDAALDRLQNAPAIFQQLVDGIDIRATLVDDDVFAVAIRSGRAFARLDWRMDAAPAIARHELPPGVASRLRQFARRLGLRFAAFDLRRTKRGDYLFLEANPAGQFLFAEVHGRVPVVRALARALLHRPQGDRSAMVTH